METSFRAVAPHVGAAGLGFLLVWALACILYDGVRRNRPAGTVFMLGVPLIVGAGLLVLGVYALT